MTSHRYVCLRQPRGTDPNMHEACSDCGEIISPGGGIASVRGRLCNLCGAETVSPSTLGVLPGEQKDGCWPFAYESKAVMSLACHECRHPIQAGEDIIVSDCGLLCLTCGRVQLERRTNGGCERLLVPLSPYQRPHVEDTTQIFGIGPVTFYVQKARRFGWSAEQIEATARLLQAVVEIGVDAAAARHPELYAYQNGVLIFIGDSSDSDDD